MYGFEASGRSKTHAPDTGALIIRIGFGGMLYYNYNKEPPKPCSNH